VVAIVVAAQLGGGLVPAVLAAAPDKSEVALVLDFSASILNDKTTRNRFGAALERIADRVDATSADLVAGDATVSIVQFAAKAIDYKGCTDLRLLGSPETVAKFAACLRSVARAYRKGLDPALTKSIGIDTNYVAAMQQAAKHLPADSVRPVMILFTDGKHDVNGVPLSQVEVVHDRLFGKRSPFALLPVGMGLAAKDRAVLEAGLRRLQIIRDMPACVSGTTFEWPQVVFQSPDQAGNAVAVALQDATCTFTVAPEPTASPTPKPPMPGVVRALRIRAHDGQIDLTWAPPAAPDPPIIDYLSRCAAGGAEWIESTEGVSVKTTATVLGVPEANDYRCEVAAVGAAGPGPYVAAIAATLVAPPAPGKPTVGALDRAVQVAIAPLDPTLVTGYHYECSADNGQTWLGILDTPPEETSVQIGNLTNGTSYVCQAFAQGAGGRSDASPMSDIVKPCGSAFECTPVLVPIAGIFGLVLLGVIAFLVAAYLRSRRRGYVVAVVDVVHIANLGHGSRTGIRFVKDPGTRRLTGLIADRGPEADIKIRHLGGGRFVVRDRMGRRNAESGESIITADATGVRHELVLRAFDTKAASQVTSRV
jgi:hypothetical protein